MTVRASVVEHPGSPAALVIRDVEGVEPGRGDVVVRVRAAGVNPVDAGNRQDPSWAGISPPYVVGYEFAGDVLHVGSTVTHVAVGQRVWGLLPVRGTRWGAYAEQLVAPAGCVAAAPDALPLEEAGCLPLAGATAIQVLQRLRLSADDWLLVFGAAGGVGHLVTQAAVSAGINVAAVASEKDHAYLHELGVSVVISRHEKDAAAKAHLVIGQELDGVADLVGGQMTKSLLHLRVGGSASTIVSLDGDLDEAIDRNISIQGVLVRPGQRALSALADEVAKGLRPIIVDTYSLDESAKAHERLAAGGFAGKLVIKP